MGLTIRWEPEARDDLQNLEKPIQAEIERGINAVAQHGLSHNAVSLAERRGELYYRLKVDNEDGLANHRVFFGVEDSTIVVYGVFHRADAYTQFKSVAFENRLP